MAVLAKAVFRKIKENVYVDPANIFIKKCDAVLLETDSGLEFAKIIETEKNVKVNKNTKVYKVVRTCNQEDFQIVRENEEAALKLKQKCVEIIKKHELDMSLTTLEYIFNRDKICIYYTAEGRIDFRELVKDLSQQLKSKIQMVQIGTRDESKMLGGIGPCGRILCCKDFIKSFSPIVIDMAKDQEISLNSSKISGVCGRLLCCLGYEHKQYKELSENLPNLKQKVTVTKDGKGTVVCRDILKQKVTVEFDDGIVKQYDVSDLSFAKKKK